MIDIFENERNIYQTPYHLEGNVRAAGFVDLEIRKVKLIMGDWAEGYRLDELHLNSRSEIEGGGKRDNRCFYGDC